MKMKYLLSVLTILLMNSNFGYTMDDKNNSFDSIKSEDYIDCGENNDNKKEEDKSNLQLSQIVGKADFNNDINNKTKSMIYDTEKQNEEKNSDVESITYEKENQNNDLEERDPMKAGHIFTKKPEMNNTEAKPDEAMQFSDIVNESELNLQNFDNFINNNEEDDKNELKFSVIDKAQIDELENKSKPEDYKNINDEQMSNLNIETIIKEKNPEEKKNELAFSFIE